VINERQLHRHRVEAGNRIGDGRHVAKGPLTQGFDYFYGAYTNGETIMIDSTHLKAHRTAASLVEKGVLHAASVAPRAD
jgi:hypothetical protein